MSQHRDQQRAEFLQSTGWKNSKPEALQQDASFRRYFRVTSDQGSALLMDAPPPMENVGAFLDITKRLQNTGVRVPRIYQSDEKSGFVLLEDLGDQTFTHLLDNGIEEEPLYRHAFNSLNMFQQSEHMDISGLSPYGIQAILQEVSLFCDWYLPAVKGQQLKAKDKNEFERIWIALEQALPPVKPVLVHRDFHVDNLMMFEGECALIDYQDALSGSPVYDLVSLLEDARRDVSDPIQTQLKQEFLDKNLDLDRSLFESQYSFWAVQRHCKVAGIFVRLWLRDGKSNYLVHLPRVIGLLKKHLQHAQFGPLSNWIEQQMQGVQIYPKVGQEKTLEKTLKKMLLEV